MRKFIFIAVVLFISGTLWAQNLPIDFEGSDHNFSAFGGAQFTRDKDPLRINNNVGHITNTGGDKFEGVFIDLKDGIQLDLAKKIYFSVYHSDGDSFTFQIKLEKNTNGEPDIYVQKTVKNTTWHHDSFDFSKAKVVGTNAGVNGRGRYNRITLFFEPNQLKSGRYYVDDIRDFASKLPPTSSGNMPVYDKLVWSDEFDYAGKPNPMKWHHQVIPPNDGGWFNNEIQHYTNKRDNSFVGDGSMKIVLKKEKFTYDNSTKDYTSARLNSKFAFTYGRIDVRAKLPSGSGVWPAIWTLGTNVGETGNYWGKDAATVGWPACGELDIMESWGHNPRYVSSAVHTKARYGGVETGGISLPDPYNNYHVYSMVWSPVKIWFFVDDKEIHNYGPEVRTPENWPFSKDQYILLNIAVLPQVDAKFDSSRMEIDYVRVYQKAITASLNDAKKGKLDVLYPNPTSDKLFVKEMGEFTSYAISEMNGRILQCGSLQGQPYIDVSQLTAGVYQIALKPMSPSISPESDTIFRFVKE
jgi:beta-glucanase (GH16 family)